MTVTDRVSVRFFATLTANVLRSAISFVTGLLIARALGVARYGDLNFLLGSFAAITFLLDAGTSSAFYTFISARRRPPAFFVLYLTWTIGVQFSLTLAVIAWLLPQSAIRNVWLEQPKPLILLACAASFLMTQLWMTVTRLAEASRKTVLIQSASVAQALLHLVLVVAVWRLGTLNVAVILTLLIIEFALFSMVATPLLIRANVTTLPEARMPVRDVVRLFVVYAAPLAMYGWVNSAYGFANRWLLQKYGGAVEQGFFSVAQQLSVIAFLATSSILNVLWKEVAEAKERGDNARLQRMYVTTRRAVYLVAAIVSCLLVPFAREVLAVSVGAQYVNGWPTAALLFLFPVHQAIGQILSTFYFAMSETGVYTGYSIATMLISIPATYLMLAPRNARIPGLGLGSFGLALSLVVIQIFATSIQSYIAAKHRGWPNDLGFQTAILTLFLALGFASRALGRLMFEGLALLIAGGVIYGLVAGVALLTIPQLADERTLVRQILQRRRGAV